MITKRILLIPISIEPDGVNLWYFKLPYIIQSLKYERSTRSGCKDIGDKKIRICGHYTSPLKQNR